MSLTRSVRHRMPPPPYMILIQGIDDIVAGPGATPLFAVIALAIFAVRVFEPRLMWKAGEVR